MLDEWTRRRDETSGDITHWKQAKSPIDWPALPEFDPVYLCGQTPRRDSTLRSELRFRGLGYLTWQRPASCELPVLTPEGGGRRLLATGEVVDEKGDVVDVGTQIMGMEGGLSEDGASTVGNGSVDEEMTDTE